MNRRVVAALSWLALASALGCGGAPPPVDLAAAWPAEPGDYRDTTRAWTRSGTLRDLFDQELQVHATLKSPDWRAAYVDFRADREKMTPGERAELAQMQRAAAAEAHEVQLLVTTYERRENDLQKGERSVWRLVLIDDDGNEVEPLSIQRDRRPTEIVRAEYPQMGDFAVPYVVKFPATLQAFGDDARAVTLKMSSPRGAVVMTWADG